MTEPITPAWLRSIGFRLDSSHVDNQPHMYLGIDRRHDSFLEVAESSRGCWTVWLRSDMAGSRTRFVYVRSVSQREQLLALIEAITGEQPETVKFDREQFEIAWTEEAADCKRRYREWCEGGRWPR